MLSLKDQRWKDFEGGYRVKYDASVPLAKLEDASTDPEPVWEEMWEELHHQGDIGMASLAAVPHIVRITKERGVFSYHPFGLVVTIDLVKGEGENPDVPEWLKDDYAQALQSLAAYACQRIGEEWQDEITKTVLSLLALVKGNRDLAELILEVDTGSEKEALEKYFE